MIKRSNRIIARFLQYFSRVSQGVNGQRLANNISIFMLEGSSLQGRKPTQEDAYVLEQNQHGALMLVADGVGGHGHGDFASQYVTDLFRRKFHEFSGADPQTFLLETARDCARGVLEKEREDPSYRNCGTTLTGAFVQQGFYWTINIGDSRTYLLDSTGVLVQLTRDHSQAQRQFDAGEITEEEALRHPRRNMMESAIGQPLEIIKIDVQGPRQLLPGQTLFTFSDGVTDVFLHRDLERLICSHPLNTMLPSIITKASYERGSSDNITACMLHQNANGDL